MNFQSLFKKQQPQPAPEARHSLSTTNSYMAAYYMINGATLENINIGKGTKNYKQWTFKFSNVPESIYQNGIMGKAEANVLDIERERRNLKRFIERTSKR